ncbi:hypothetical protein D3C72_2487430 [compost metagenome]
MIGGRQAALGLVSSRSTDQAIELDDAPILIGQRPRPLPNRLSEADLAAHAALIAKIGAKAIWAKYDPQD